ncbi:unnamed protein product, partial [Allacma fusca]
MEMCASSFSIGDGVRGDEEGRGKVEYDLTLTYPGFVINYKQEAGDWEEYKLGSRANNHILGGLICGSKYQLFITAFNKIGTGKPSEILQARTKGT